MRLCIQPGNGIFIFGDDFVLNILLDCVTACPNASSLSFGDGAGSKGR